MDAAVDAAVNANGSVNAVAKTDKNSALTEAPAGFEPSEPGPSEYCSEPSAFAYICLRCTIQRVVLVAQAAAQPASLPRPSLWVSSVACQHFRIPECLEVRSNVQHCAECRRR